MDRRLVAKKRKMYNAVKLIQKMIRGKLGKIRWKLEYWRSVSVVKSDSALKVMNSWLNLITNLLYYLIIILGDSRSFKFIKRS